MDGSEKIYFEKILSTLGEINEKVESGGSEPLETVQCTLKSNCSGICSGCGVIYRSVSDNNNLYSLTTCDENQTVTVDVPKNTFVYLVLKCADSPSNISGITTADTTINCGQFDFDLFNDFQTAFTAYADADFTFEVSRGGVS